MTSKLPLRVYRNIDIDAPELMVWQDLCDTHDKTRVYAVRSDRPIEYGDVVYHSQLHTEESYYTAWVQADQYIIDLGCGWGDRLGTLEDRANYETLIETHGGDAFVYIGDSLDNQSLGMILGRLPEGWHPGNLRGVVQDLERLENYPILNEYKVSEMTEGLVAEAWGSWLRWDTVSDLCDLEVVSDIEDRTNWSAPYREDPRSTDDIVWEIYQQYEGNEWNATSATEVSNGRHEDAVRYVADTLFSNEVPPVLARAVRLTSLKLDRLMGDVDWRSRVDTDRLDMNDPYECVLGQVFDSKYQDANDNYFSGWYRAEDTHRSIMERHGRNHIGLVWSRSSRRWALMANDWTNSQLNWAWKESLSGSAL